METLTYDEFVEKYYKTNNKWKFNLFKIICLKCGSEKVEFNSDLTSGDEPYTFGSGNYGAITSPHGSIIVKCHGCGNAFTLEFSDLES